MCGPLPEPDMIEKALDKYRQLRQENDSLWRENTRLRREKAQLNNGRIDRDTRDKSRRPKR